MAFAAAAMAEPQREPTAYGDLSLLARQALMPQEERIRSVLAIRDQLLGPLRSQLEMGQVPARRRREAQQFRDDLRRADPGPVRENPRYAEADVLRTGSRSAQQADQAAASGGPAASLLPHTPIARAERRGAAGELRQILAEIRALRNDVAQLSRLVAPANQELEFSEVTSTAQPGSDNEIEQFAQEAASGRELLGTFVRRNELARVSLRQQDLLRALQRATGRLERIPRDAVPAGLYDGVIGEIYRARFSIALFGGTQGVGQLAGQNFSTAV